MRRPRRSGAKGDAGITDGRELGRQMLQAPGLLVRDMWGTRHDAGLNVDLLDGPNRVTETVAGREANARTQGERGAEGGLSPAKGCNCREFPGFGREFFWPYTDTLRIKCRDLPGFE
jgi:hypothetical protein